MTNQPQQTEQKKLAWQCRRGMLELDVILIPFLERFFPQLPKTEQQTFASLLSEADPDLYTWIMGYGQAKDPNLQQMVDLIREKMDVA